MGVHSTWEDDTTIFSKSKPNRNWGTWKDIRSINQVGPINVRHHIAIKTRMITTFAAGYKIRRRNFSDSSKAKCCHCRATKSGENMQESNDKPAISNRCWSIVQSCKPDNVVLQKSGLAKIRVMFRGYIRLPMEPVAKSCCYKLRCVSPICWVGGYGQDWFFSRAEEGWKMKMK